MKTLKELLFVLVVCLSFSALAQKQKTIETAIIQTKIYCDHCKACETCGPVFSKLLLKEKGIQMATLDDKAMTIKVVYNTKKTNIAAIRTAISKLGYDADDVKANRDAYEALDGCCKKSN